tara:strand:+ start:193 stop:561 length:369 start_codon:yes stop_codon:yes gene_type:complete
MKKLLFIVFVIVLMLNFQNISLSDEKNLLKNKITKNLRCLICQGQSVYDSQSEFALSIKILVQNQIDEGMSEKEIYNFLKDQYGEWIVYEPEFSKKNFILWIFPLILFIFGGLFIYRKVYIK